MMAKKIVKNIDLRTYFSMKDMKRTFSLLWPYIARQRVAYWGLFLIMLVDISLTLAYAWFFGSITDAAVQGDLPRIKGLALLGASLVLISVTSTYVDAYLESVAVNAVKRDLKADLLKHILLLPAKNVNQLRSGDVLSHFSNDINSIDGAIGYSLIKLIKFPLIFIAVLVYLLHLSWKLCLLSLLVAPIAGLSGVVFGLLLRNNSRKIYRLFGSTQSLLNDIFHGFLVIRSFAMEKLFAGKYLEQNRELYALEIKDAKLRGSFHAGGEFIGSIVFLGSLCLGAYFVSDKIITVGSLLAFVNLVNRLVYPLTGLAGQWAGFQRSVSAVERIADILAESPEAADLPTYTPSKPFAKSIVFQDITFGYDGQINLFEHFHLQIPAGKVVAIVGPSGAGKTSLFNLLQGLYKPQEGSILIDGCATESMSPSELRSFFSYVPQETYLFAGTIRENLLLVRPGVTEAEMIRAATTANIHPFILSLPDGYDTEVGERGIRLSGGQKQRIAIARAIIRNAPILLLDEATSALDSETEYYVKEALDRLMAGRTTLIIAHRLSTIHHADFIIVMDKGTIVQMGRHEELSAKKGLYADLHRLQWAKGGTVVDSPLDTSIV
jgi:ABC-type multidrug transport system fused ATPase/permease subunit